MKKEYMIYLLLIAVDTNTFFQALINSTTNGLFQFNIETHCKIQRISIIKHTVPLPSPLSTNSRYPKKTRNSMSNKTPSLLFSYSSFAARAINRWRPRVTNLVELTRWHKGAKLINSRGCRERAQGMGWEGRIHHALWLLLPGRRARNSKFPTHADDNRAGDISLCLCFRRSRAEFDPDGEDIFWAERILLDFFRGEQKVESGR